MEKGERNWHKDFLYNEGISDCVWEILTIYSRLVLNYPEHPDAVVWGQAARDWNQVRLDLPKLFFGTEQEAQEYLERLIKLKRTVKTLEEQLRILSAGNLEWFVERMNRIHEINIGSNKVDGFKSNMDEDIKASILTGILLDYIVNKRSLEPKLAKIIAEYIPGL